jgi:hypothetical protein
MREAALDTLTMLPPEPPCAVLPVLCQRACLQPSLARRARVLEDAGAIEVEEGTGNSFHLGPILRK